MNKKALMLAFISFYTFLLFPLAPLWAQELEFPPDADCTAPLIQHDPPAQSAPTGKDLVVQATITDNVSVKEITLFYRPMGNVEYFSTNMNSIGNNVFTATIQKQEVLEPGIEYYIQASDQAGNMVMRGFSFSPLVITVAPVLPTPEEEPVVIVPPTTPSESLALKTEEPTVKPWYKKWWVWTIAGAVIIGGAAAAAGSGGGGGGGGEPTSAGGQTGSATITGPTP